MKIVLMILSCIAFLLTGCGESAKIKQKVQTDLDAYNPNNDKGYCLALDSDRIIFPYVTTNNPPPIGSGFQVELNDRLNNRLKVFFQAGLLARDIAGQEAEIPIYRYNLTPLGLQYFYTFSKHNAFCFGKVIIDDVEIDGARDDNWGCSTKWFHFKFHLENVPLWVSDNADTLSSAYRDNIKKIIKNGYQPMAGALISTPEGWALDSSYSYFQQGY